MGVLERQQVLDVRVEFGSQVGEGLGASAGAAGGRCGLGMALRGSVQVRGRGVDVGGRLGCGLGEFGVIDAGGGCGMVAVPLVDLFFHGAQIVVVQ
ncbi:hypothetical protein [Streptomyces sp. SID13588]|uniref:hypothetical protein n=1 Tax=Streptomyces sp. SID13588 TaxID=2706051 RepID=UPI0013C9BE59|nr:hypothetical protein [Streptomyces sp. SID13588]NEA76778.1 hypothetical protein [Streptomyces sp. SID13588]